MKRASLALVGGLIARRRKRDEVRRRRRRAAAVVGGVSAAGLVAFVERRRRRTGSVSAAMRHGANEAVRKVTPDRAYDDKTLENKVQTELFRPEDAPKDKVNVQVVDGIVELRGTVDEKQAAELAAKAEQVEGVSGVRNLLTVA